MVILLVILNEQQTIVTFFKFLKLEGVEIDNLLYSPLNYRILISIKSQDFYLYDIEMIHIHLNSVLIMWF